MGKQEKQQKKFKKDVDGRQGECTFVVLYIILAKHTPFGGI